MELGNELFGNSRGEWPIPRHAGYEAPISMLIQEMGGDGGGYGSEFENSTFSMFPYYWGECSCGYEEAERLWSDSHEHKRDCYQTAYRALLGEYEASFQVPEGLERGLCQKFGIPWNDGFGAAVHCTCDYRQKWADFLRCNAHAEACPIVRPNFFYKPTGLSVKWYKYPLRDSYASREVPPDEWRRVMLNCIASLKDASVKEPK